MNLQDALENLEKLSVGQLKFTKQLAKMSAEHLARAIADAKTAKAPNRAETVAALEAQYAELGAKRAAIEGRLAAKEGEEARTDAARQIYAQKLDERQQRLLIANEIKKVSERVLLQAEIMGLKFPRLVRISVVEVGTDRSKDVNVYIVDEDDKEASAQAEAETKRLAQEAVQAVLKDDPAK